MEQFKTAYLQKCSELSIEPLGGLMSFLKEREGSSDAGKPRCKTETLDLTGIPISLKACSALSYSLAENSFFTKIVLADAFLGDDGAELALLTTGCIKLANALKSNATLTYLDLRGNSIRSDGAIALGQMLKVNNKLESLFLEWNCLGIWDNGIRAISEALSINETLRVLDLRNNKVGPESTQTMAHALKYNTSLRKLDMRWNSCGLLGGRAFADLLQCNRTMVDLELAGNEVPEDILQNICASLERNRERWQTQVHSKAHAENLASTIQTLTLSHQEALLQLQHKYSQETNHSESLAGKLSSASSELQQMQEALHSADMKCFQLEKENKALEERLLKETSDLRQQLNDRHADFQRERENWIGVEKKHQAYVSSANERYLELDAKNKKLSLDAEIATKDKRELLLQLEEQKEKETRLNHLWEEKLQRAEMAHHAKLLGLQDLKDREFLEKSKKYEDKIRQLEGEKTRLEEDIGSIKAKFLNEKRGWLDEQAIIEARVRQEQSLHIQELEARLKSTLALHATRTAELEESVQRYSAQKKELEAELKQIAEEKTGLHNQLAALQTEGRKHTLELNHVRLKLEEARAIEGEVHHLKSEIAKLQDQAGKEKKEVDRLTNVLASRNSTVQKLKELLKRRDLDLEAKDEEYILKVANAASANVQMKELQLSIGSLLTATSKSRHRYAEIDAEELL
ncbi:Leucine-rich repeat-containing protein 45 [Kappamyces sp. JEL0680]|nr:Leucine-rich repeat-containing protein 45 [Kappamyces sp. JEL0680]